MVVRRDLRATGRRAASSCPTTTLQRRRPTSADCQLRPAAPSRRMRTSKQTKRSGRAFNRFFTHQFFPRTAVKSTMSESDVKKAVVSLARRLNGYKGRIRQDLAKLDHNFTTLRGSPASLLQLEAVRRYFKHVDSSAQLAR